MVLKTVEPALLQDTLAFLECAGISTGQQTPRVPRDASLMRVTYVSVTSSNVFQAASQSVQPEKYKFLAGHHGAKYLSSEPSWEVKDLKSLELGLKLSNRIILG